MTNNIRVFLWLGLGLALWLNYSQWQMDYGPKPETTAVAGTTGAPAVASNSETVPQASQTTPAATTESATTSIAAASPAPSATVEATAPPAGKIRVATDVIVLDIDLRGGTLVYAELPGYPVVKGKPEPIVLFHQGDPATNYVLQSGLAGDKADEARPSHLAVFSSASDKYSLPNGQDELRVPLTWTDGQGVTVTKTFVFHRSMFTIGIEYAVDNQSAAPWVAHSYARIVRSDPAVQRSAFNYKPEAFAFRGPAIWAIKQNDEKRTYHKLKLEKPEEIDQFPPVEGGWLAGMQHHFVSVIVPDPTKKYQYSLLVKGREYILGAMGPGLAVAPSSNAVIKESLFVGPKLQKQLITLNPELDHVADYGMLTLLSRPLFALLQILHKLVQNWGLAIILATFILKLLFYPLSEKAGRSQAKMRALAPRMKALQETYKDDRSKLGQATMELYRSEKVNPLAGCLPMLIQMPVFIAFYWVLLESVEMRQAPFFGWINDLSSRDPYFILPALNGLAMWFQQKLNPPPPDPMQAKIFQFMPVIFSVMFALFPAGLVLYWVTNTGLGILQQWNINRKVQNEAKAARK
ncbi:MAG TPA: membrane protein insertase YidC [Steroidobacteraceae bacterium]|nr:membrane protein insertase YidC [Steroidobacteraceae bacterium]